MQLVFGVYTKLWECMLLSFTAHFSVVLFPILVLFQRIFGVVQIDRCLLKGIAVHLALVASLIRFPRIMLLFIKYKSEICWKFKVIDDV
jgi:hypothetical protein